MNHLTGPGPNLRAIRTEFVAELLLASGASLALIAGELFADRAAGSGLHTHPERADRTQSVRHRLCTPTNTRTRRLTTASAATVRGPCNGMLMQSGRP